MVSMKGTIGTYDDVLLLLQHLALNVLHLLHLILTFFLSTELEYHDELSLSLTIFPLSLQIINASAGLEPTLHQTMHQLEGEK